MHAALGLAAGLKPLPHLDQCCMGIVTLTGTANSIRISAMSQKSDITIVQAMRGLRMGLREVTTRLLVDRRWRAFAEPVTPEEDPEYLDLVGFCSGTGGSMRELRVLLLMM